MRLLILLSIVLLTATVLYADPFLTCDPQFGVTKYKLTIDTIESLSDANADGSAWHDLINIPAGDHDAILAAGKHWTIDGVLQPSIEWSDPSPFVLGRPDVSQLPTNISLRDNH
jgi:hypothetical protein